MSHSKSEMTILSVARLVTLVIRLGNIYSFHVTLQDTRNLQPESPGGQLGVIHPE